MAREQKPSYLCPGFYPLEADNLMHAACLFAVGGRGVISGLEPYAPDW